MSARLLAKAWRSQRAEMFGHPLNAKDLRRLHKGRNADTVLDNRSDQTNLVAMGRRTGQKVGLDLNLLAPADRHAVLRTLTLMQDDAALEESHRALQGGSKNEIPFDKPIMCPTCGAECLVKGDRSEGTRYYVPYVNRLAISYEFSFCVRRRALQLVSESPTEPPITVWSRAIDLELMRMAQEALEMGVNPW